MKSINSWELPAEGIWEIVKNKAAWLSTWGNVQSPACLLAETPLVCDPVNMDGYNKLCKDILESMITTYWQEREWIKGGGSVG